MKRMLLLLLTLALVLPTAATADSADVALGLANVIAAETFCGLSYDQPAIEAFIAERVSADDLDFTSSLTMFIAAAEYTQGEMSKSAATAHCAQVRRNAVAYGFVPQ